MKNAIIVHGTCDKEEYYSLEYPSASNFHWLPWLAKQLLIKDIYAVTPEMPHGYMPNYAVWKQEFERFDITPETTLVGHSCGGGFLMRWLSENNDQRVGKVVLVAPWIDPNKTKGEDNDFFDFIMDPEMVSRTQGVTIFNSDDDMEAVHTSVQQIMDTVPDIKLVEFDGKGHFCLGDLGGEAFPELLEEVLN
jgi:predicted alpha/beta hydrolase family esterase